jgi:large subunit ribosomal protein L23
MAELHEILIRPMVTEKSVINIESENTYVFEVGLRANKHQIRSAVESVYDVKVDDVRTLIVRGKSKRFGRFMGKRSNWKKAYIKLADGHNIPLLDE